MKLKSIISTLICVLLLTLANPFQIESHATELNAQVEQTISTLSTEKVFDLVPESRQTFIGNSGSCRMDYMPSSRSISWGVRLNVGVASFSGFISIKSTGTSTYSDSFLVSGTSDVLDLPYMPSGSYSAQLIGTAIGLDGNSYHTVPNAIIYFYR